MGYLTETSSWEEHVKQIEKSERVKGGPDGPPNVQAGQLANRTLFLKNAIATINSAVTSLKNKVGDGSLSECLKKAQNLNDLANKTLARQNLGAASSGHNHNGTYSPVGHNHSGTYSPASHTHTASQVGAAPSSHSHDERYLKKGDYSTASVISKVKAGDGSGSGVDADTVDGKHASAFAPAVHTHSEYAKKTEISAAVPAGTVIAFSNSTPPTGYLECNGASLSKTTYSKLYAAIGTRYGSTSTTFKLPDLRGEFIRGWDHGRGTDSGRTLGNSQSDGVRDLNIPVTYTTYTGNAALCHLNNAAYLMAGLGNSADPKFGSYNANVLSSIHKTIPLNMSSNETRPRNVALVFCIKY